MTTNPLLGPAVENSEACRQDYAAYVTGLLHAHAEDLVSDVIPGEGSSLACDLLLNCVAGNWLLYQWLVAHRLPRSTLRHVAAGCGPFERRLLFEPHARVDGVLWRW